MSSPLPGIPRRSEKLEDRIRGLEEQVEQLRTRDFQLSNLRGIDSRGNQLFAADTNGQSWGIASPRLHAGMHSFIPDRANTGYTFAPLLTSIMVCNSQQYNVGVRYSVQEGVVTGTAVGEFEIRWNLGFGALPARTDPHSYLIKAWNTAGFPGNQGLAGELFDFAEYIWPQDGSTDLVTFGDGLGITVSVWSRIRPATGNPADVTRVSPMWSYQSGWGAG